MDTSIPKFKDGDNVIVIDAMTLTHYIGRRFVVESSSLDSFGRNYIINALDNTDVAVFEESKLILVLDAVLMVLV